MISRRLFLLLVLVVVFPLASTSAGERQAKVYVVLWFDTEDYILPASDDAAKQVAEFLTKEGIRGTFKVVGEKARTLERRNRQDVIEALKKHEIGYHSNYHSVQPTPAMYLSNLGWDEGVAEFDRRERPGLEDVRRVFGQVPSCYGQPGSSWGPQSYGAMRKWGMQVYLDAGSHVRLDDKPHYYCGILNLYKLTQQLRAGLSGPRDLEVAQQQFAAAREKLLGEGGGIVSTIYHPCEFVHKQFWDGVNFRAGANPPRDRWVLPPAKSPEDSQAAFAIFEGYIHFMKRFPEVQFITATEAMRIYQDKARQQEFAEADLQKIAAAVTEDVTYQKHGAITLAPSEIFDLLTRHVQARQAGSLAVPLKISTTPLGPTGNVLQGTEPIQTDVSQFRRTVQDVADYLDKHGRIPSSVWLGSKPVPPEMFLQGLSEVSKLLATGKELPEMITLRPAKLATAKYVAEDDPRLWGWVIFPPGFRAPAMMQLARKQAWTLKPALIAD